MSDHDKSDASRLPGVLSVETKDPRTGKTTARAETDLTGLPNNAAGNWARIWYLLGPVGAIIIFFFVMSGYFLHTMNGQITMLTEELREARKAAAEEREKNYERYNKSREANDGRHRDILVRMDRIVTWIEWSNQRNLGGTPVPAPKMLEEKTDE